MENTKEYIPLSQIFVHSNFDSATDFNAVSWLGSVDDSTLKRIVSSGDIFFTCEDNEDNEEKPFEFIDYLTLCLMIAEKECNTDSGQLSTVEKRNSVIGLSTLAQCEILRRKRFITINGDGKVSNFNENTTDIELTETGRLVSSSMKTMLDISTAITN